LEESLIQVGLPYQHGFVLDADQRAVQNEVGKKVDVQDPTSNKGQTVVDVQDPETMVPMMEPTMVMRGEDGADDCANDGDAEGAEDVLGTCVARVLF
tara:strand:- start:211 stop:501 length:291 start_codon:yes stop_codon:yes gene_type:complete